MKANKGVSNEKIKIIPLGGFEHIGMNITAFEYEDSIIVVDCGLVISRRRTCWVSTLLSRM